MYKDKDKQREANKERQRHYKAKQKALLSEGVTSKALPQQPWEEFSKTHVVATLRDVRAEDAAGIVEPCMQPSYVCPIPEDQRKPDINYGPYMTAGQLATAGLKANRVSVPGDPDYDGTCTPEWRTCHA